jgi:hypothetical protein
MLSRVPTSPGPALRLQPDVANITKANIAKRGDVASEKKSTARYTGFLAACGLAAGETVLSLLDEPMRSELHKNYISPLLGFLGMVAFTNISEWVKAINYLQEGEKQLRKQEELLQAQLQEQQAIRRKVVVAVGLPVIALAGIVLFWWASTWL